MHEASNWSTHANTIAALVAHGADSHRADGGGETAAEIIKRRGLNMTLDGSTAPAGADAEAVLIATPVKGDAPSQQSPAIGSLVNASGQAPPTTPSEVGRARATPTPIATPNREVVSPTQESPRRGGLTSFGESGNGAGFGQVSAASVQHRDGAIGPQHRPGGVSPPRMAAAAGGNGGSSTSSTGGPSPLRHSGSLEGLGGGTPARKQPASATASNARQSPKPDAAAKRAALKAKLERKRQLVAQAKKAGSNSLAASAQVTPSAAMVGPPPTGSPPPQGPPQPSPGTCRVYHTKNHVPAAPSSVRWHLPLLLVPLAYLND